MDQYNCVKVTLDRHETIVIIDELIDTPFNFSAFVINRLKVKTLTPELLVGPTFELIKGTCKSLVKLGYFFKEVYKAITEQLDWHNLKDNNILMTIKPLPLIPNSRGHQVIPFDHFINNDLAYLCGNMLVMYILDVESSDNTRKLRLSNAFATTSDWITCLSPNVHKKYYNPKAGLRPSIRCRELPKEAQYHQDGFIQVLQTIGAADSRRNFKKDATSNLFKSTNQERYEHVGLEVTSSQDDKVNKMAKRDYGWLMISRCSRSHSRQAKEQAQDLKSMITTSNHKLMIEVKDYELKTKVEA
ncbi:hypothetical protein Tco_0026087 [Tanacetum coccineum]